MERCYIKGFFFFLLKTFLHLHLYTPVVLKLWLIQGDVDYTKDFCIENKTLVMLLCYFLLTKIQL